MTGKNPILIELPMPITTPRLLIRPPKSGDGAELHEAVLETREALITYMPWARGELTPEKAEENVRQSVAKWTLREDLRLSIFDKASGMFAGGTGLHRVNWEIRSFEIGYWVRKRFEGQGYIKESTLALTRYAFDQLNASRVELRCNAENQRSISVIRSLGFELEGRLRNADPWVLSDAPCKDTMVFSRLDPAGLPAISASW